MAIHFTKLTPDNWRDFVRLSVSDEQRDFVDSNVFALAESGIEGYEPYGLYEGNNAVAMAVFANPSDGVGMIQHIMVGQKFQNRGYGRKMLKELLEITRKRNFRRVVLSYWPGNPAVKLYESLGFRHTGETWGDEPIMSVTL